MNVAVLLGAGRELAEEQELLAEVIVSHPQSGLGTCGGQKQLCCQCIYTVWCPGVPIRLRTLVLLEQLIQN